MPNPQTDGFHVGGGGQGAPSGGVRICGVSGTGEEWKCGRGHIANFLKGMRIDGMIAGARGGKSIGPPDARSGEPSARSTIRVCCTPSDRWSPDRSMHRERSSRFPSVTVHPEFYCGPHAEGAEDAENRREAPCWSGWMHGESGGSGSSLNGRTAGNENGGGGTIFRRLRFPSCGPRDQAAATASRAGWDDVAGGTWASPRGWMSSTEGVAGSYSRR
jgi:hypothetical protein